MNRLSRHRAHLFATLSSIILLTLGSTVHADVVYSNFGPGDTYSGGSFRVSGPASRFGAYSNAASFTASQAFTLTSFELATNYSAGTNSFLFSIVADNGGLPTGSSLFSTTGPANNGISTFSATGSLLAGQKYWLVMASEASNADGGWNHLGLDSQGEYAQRTGSGNWTTQNRLVPVFRIKGTPVNAVALTPEMPAGVQAIPMLLAVGGMALYQRKKKAAQS